MHEPTAMAEPPIMQSLFQRVEWKLACAVRAARQPTIRRAYASYPEILDRDDVRIMHLIRDPRDVLISAMHYHRKSTEAWLQSRFPATTGSPIRRRSEP